MSSEGLPEEFVEYIYVKRLEAVKKMASGQMNEKEILFEFTRASPVVVTDGPAGLSGSVKMVGFVPKDEYLSEFLQRVRRLIGAPRSEIVRNLAYFYSREKLDLSLLGGLEMAFKHSWTNIRATGKATLVFFTPPVSSFEVRCDVEIHEEDDICEYLNMMHNIYHGPRGDRIYPTYIFKIREIYDQSATDKGFGRLIYRVQEDHGKT